MIEIWHQLVNVVLPFDWARYDFMKNALLAVLLVAPLYALLGTMVISNHMAFFSDVLGHAMLTGIAIGVVLGFVDPLLPMIIFAVILAVLINLFKGMTKAASDTVLGVFFATVVALGVVLLSRGGGFAKFTTYLIGDILAVSPADLIWLVVINLVVLLFWYFRGNALVLLSINSVLARSRGVPVFLIETIFSALLAVVVASSIRLVGILIVNSLLILPAAAARNFSSDLRSYTKWSIMISLISGVAGLISSYYWGTASGATVVLFAAAFYYLAVIWGKIWEKKKLRVPGH